MSHRGSSRLILMLALAGPLGAGRAQAADTDGPARLAEITRLALQAHPDLRADRARVEAAGARARMAGRLPEPMLKYEQWGVPPTTAAGAG